jgi:hypothetical protein
MNRAMKISPDWSELPCSAKSGTSGELGDADALRKKINTY